MKYQNQTGFTLIELVIVIIILGILSAVALPKFVNLSSDATTSVINGLAGATHGAANLAYAKASIDNVEKNKSAYLTGLGSITYGYPSVTRDGLDSFLDAESSYQDIDKEWVWGANNTSAKHYKVFSLSSLFDSVADVSSASKIEAKNCYMKYFVPMAEGEGYSVEVESSGC